MLFGAGAQYAGPAAAAPGGEFVFRFLVASKAVGAFMGRGGVTIQAITRSTRASEPRGRMASSMMQSGVVALTSIAF